MEKPSWLMRLWVTLMTIALVIMGFFFFAVALAIGALLALVIGIRLWWTMRKLKAAHNAAGGVSRDAASARGAPVVEGEYQVIERETTATRLPPSAEDKSV